MALKWNQPILVLLLLVGLVFVAQASSFKHRQRQQSRSKLDARTLAEIIGGKRSPWQQRRHLRGNRRALNSRIHTTQDMSVWTETMRTSTNKGAPGQERVSFKECNINGADRLDCGHSGITAEQCAARECCWSSSNEDGSPSCYHSITTATRLCAMDAGDRQECGWNGMRKEQCLDRGCCWQPISQHNVPWCYKSIVFPIFEGECGKTPIAPNIKQRVVNGVPARPHSWPWQVSLQIDGMHFCGGSLVNEQWIVSAAHCEGGFHYGYTPEVVLGAHTILSGSTDEYEEVRLAPELVVSHEDFDTLPTGLNDDIMLVKLERPVNFTDAIQPVCLAEQGQEFPAGKPCYTTGWGNLAFMGDSPDELQQVQLPLVSYATCNQTGWYDGYIHESMICAGYEEGGRGSCHGDSGGPMVCQDGDRWVLAGAVSWGFGGCAAPNYPTVFAKIAYEREWLDGVYTENMA